VAIRRRWLQDVAPGLTARSVLEKFAAVQMIDVHLEQGAPSVLGCLFEPQRGIL
jgi:hypothetical protein